MPTPRPSLPDCTLDSLHDPAPPPHLRRAFLIEAGRACARYVREGGELGDIRNDTCRFRNGRLELHPLPAGERRIFPDKSHLIRDLEMLEDRWRPVAPDSRSRMVFLAAFIRTLSPENPMWRPWARVWIRQREHRLRDQVRGRYHTLLQSTAALPQQALVGAWSPNPEVPLEQLQAALSHILSDNKNMLSHGRRADVVIASLFGEEVVIKRFAANPRPWRRRWEVSRARRAWIGSTLLREVGVNTSAPMGWLEVRSEGKVRESYFICSLLPTRENVRTWMRRILPRLNHHERVRLRHQLRAEIIRLQQHGLCHIDLKLLNLLVRETEPGSPTFYWIDLEDIRPGQASFRTVIRNFYQLNGSLPRNVSPEERRAFAAGFRRFHPLAVHPLVLTYVERKTRKRHQDELSRLKSA